MSVGVYVFKYNPDSSIALGKVFREFVVAQRFSQYPEEL